MEKRCLVLAGLSVIAFAIVAHAQEQKGDVRVARPVRQSDLPDHMRPEAKVVKGYVPPKTAWGDPQISGAYTNSDESGIPFEKPAQFADKKLSDVTPEQLVDLQKQRQEATLERAPTLSTVSWRDEPAALV